MKALVLSNNKFEVKEIDNTLEALQSIVGGYIEIPYLSKRLYENGIDIIINEEGKFIDGLKAEIAVIDKDTNKVVDLVFGNCIFASHDEEGNTTELTEAQEQFLRTELKVSIVLTYADTEESFICKALFI